MKSPGSRSLRREEAASIRLTCGAAFINTYIDYTVFIDRSGCVWYEVSMESTHLS
jgi:hypothetical protein